MPELSRRSLFAGVAAGATLAALSEASAGSASAVTGSIGCTDSRYLFDPMNYIARGTVFTRSVANMKVAANSSEIAANMPTLDDQVRKAHNKTGFPDWLTTSTNTDSYNIPIYVTDSRVAGCPTQNFKTLGFGYDTPTMLNGAIPCPDPNYAGPAYGGDQEFALFDRGTGIMREFYGAEYKNGMWQCQFGGWSVANPDFVDLAHTNPQMKLVWGSSAVVKMHNSLSHIGMRELRAGVINHAISFTMPDGAPGASWPATGSDGGWTASAAPHEGQWFRVPQHVDVEALDVSPYTRLLLRSLQIFGGYFDDHNVVDFAAKIENPFTVPGGTQETLIDPLVSQFGYGVRVEDINDMPWNIMEFAEVDWNDMTQAAPSALPLQYNAGDWSVSTTGTWRSGRNVSAPRYQHALEFSGAVADHYTGSATFKRRSFYQPSAIDLTIPVRVRKRDREVIITVKDGATTLASTSSRSPKPLRFHLGVGTHNLSISFVPQGDSEADWCSIGSMVPKRS